MRSTPMSKRPQSVWLPEDGKITIETRSGNPNVANGGVYWVVNEIAYQSPETAFVAVAEAMAAASVKARD
jgi:hypothetical protein